MPIRPAGRSLVRAFRSAGALLLPHGISAELLGTVALVAQSPLGQIGLILALLGTLFAVSGAAIDSAFSGA